MRLDQCCSSKRRSTNVSSRLDNNYSNSTRETRRRRRTPSISLPTFPSKVPSFSCQPFTQFVFRSPVRTRRFERSENDRRVRTLHATVLTQGPIDHGVIPEGIDWTTVARPIVYQRMQKYDKLNHRSHAKTHLLVCLKVQPRRNPFQFNGRDQ